MNAETYDIPLFRAHTIITLRVQLYVINTEMSILYNVPKIQRSFTFSNEQLFFLIFREIVYFPNPKESSTCYCVYIPLGGSSKRLL